MGLLWSHYQANGFKFGAAVLHEWELLVLDNFVSQRNESVGQKTGPHFNIKAVSPGMGIPMLKIRRSRDRLIFNMVVPTLVRRDFYIEKGRRYRFFTRFIDLLFTTYYVCLYPGYKSECSLIDSFQVNAALIFLGDVIKFISFIISGDMWMKPRL